MEEKESDAEKCSTQRKRRKWRGVKESCQCVGLFMGIVLNGVQWVL